ncbi:hypothetical protein EIL50_04515 [bacterium NHP-B]|nr:hypothetical protein EIL50_04515 [bacterium NHP-B]
MSQALKNAALRYHQHPAPGKLGTYATKPLASKEDLTLAYSPGVAYACQAIQEDPKAARLFTSRGHLVGVISNGTAVLGLGDIGPLAAKPVMEGKAVLFKKFADLDAFDIELHEHNPQKLKEHIAALAPTFGGINLEDLKAPDCFLVEEALQDLGIPVFHDDQHGTAVVVVAAIQNGLTLVGKDIRDMKLVVSGAGAAALACLHLLQHYGLQQKNTFVFDSQGLLTKDRLLDSYKEKWCQQTPRTFEESLEEADVFLGLSKGGLLLPGHLSLMAAKPLVLALANPVPEILPEDAKRERPDVIIATGRSDYPNQVNNVLCFPYIFRGALDVGATKINVAMKKACADALTRVLSEPAFSSQDPAKALETLGPDNILPNTFDERLLPTLAPAVAQAAMDTGVASHPLENLDAYQKQLQHIQRENSQM